MDPDRLDLLREMEGFTPQIQPVPKDDPIMGKLFPELSEYSDAALRGFFISWERLGLLEPLGVPMRDHLSSPYLKKTFFRKESTW